MTREEAIKAIKECTTAYRDHLNDDREVWERQQKWAQTQQSCHEGPFRQIRLGKGLLQNLSQ